MLHLCLEQSWKFYIILCIIYYTVLATSYYCANKQAERKWRWLYNTWPLTHILVPHTVTPLSYIITSCFIYRRQRLYKCSCASRRFMWKGSRPHQTQQPYFIYENLAKWNTKWFKDSCARVLRDLRGHLKVTWDMIHRAAQTKQNKKKVCKCPSLFPIWFVLFRKYSFSYLQNM